MTMIQAAILGIIQGLTEFLPISSSGHLVLFQKLFGLQEGTLAFDTVLHLGTLVAVFIVFWDDIVHMLKKPWDKLVLLLIVGTIPTGIIGVTLKDYFETVFNSGASLGVGFLLTGVILLLAERMRGRKSMDDITYSDALVVGLMQGVAIFPAVSRSGSTIAGALYRGIDREAAARFSFLLSIPAILGAAVLQTKDVIEAGVGELSYVNFSVGFVLSAIAGYFAIKFMIRLLQTGSLKVFTYYVWVLGICVLIAQFMGKF